MAKGKKPGKRTRVQTRAAARVQIPISYWSYSSLMSYLRNPLAWYKRYVEKIYDTPRNPASIIGSAGHLALEHFYSDVPKDTAIALGLEYMRAIADFEINFGTLSSTRAKKEKRQLMEREYERAISYYLARPPRHQVLGVEVKGLAQVPGVPIPVKAISDLVVESRVEKGAVDIVDHKFVDSFSKGGSERPLFAMQAIFNYYTVRELYNRPVRRFVVYECKKRQNKDGKPQLRKHVIDFAHANDAFDVFHRLLADATVEISRTRLFLPNPSDMFEGDNSFDLYRLRLGEE